MVIREFHFVGVLVAADLDLFVDRCGIGQFNLRIILNQRIIKFQLENLRFAVGRRLRVVCLELRARRQFFSAVRVNAVCFQIAVEGQALGHDIFQHIGHVVSARRVGRHVGMDGKRHLIADGRGGLVFFLFNVRRFALGRGVHHAVVHDPLRVVEVILRSPDARQIRFMRLFAAHDQHHVAADRLVVHRVRRRADLLVLHRGEAACKLSGQRVVKRRFGHPRASVCGQIRRVGIFGIFGCDPVLNPAHPLRVFEGGRAVGFNLDDLIDRHRLARFQVLHGNRSGRNGVRHRDPRHRQQHHNRQQRAQPCLHVFHFHIFLSLNCDSF